MAVSDGYEKTEKQFSRGISFCWSKGSHAKLTHPKASMEDRIRKTSMAKKHARPTDWSSSGMHVTFHVPCFAAVLPLLEGSQLEKSAAALVALAGLLGPNDRPTLTLFSHPLDRPTDHLEISLFDNNTIEQRSRDILDQSQSWLTPNTYVLRSIQRLAMRRLPTIKAPTPTAPIPMTASMADLPP